MVRGVLVNVAVAVAEAWLSPTGNGEDTPDAALALRGTASQPSSAAKVSRATSKRRSTGRAGRRRGRLLHMTDGVYHDEDNRCNHPSSARPGRTAHQ
jgi:hypothetical protein